MDPNQNNEKLNLYYRFQLIKDEKFEHELDPEFSYIYQISIEKETNTQTLGLSSRSNYHILSWPDIFSVHSLDLPFTVKIEVYEYYNSSKTPSDSFSFIIDNEFYKRKQKLLTWLNQNKTYHLRVAITNKKCIDFNQVNPYIDLKLFFKINDNEKYIPVKKKIFSRDEEYSPYFFLNITENRREYFFPLSSYYKKEDNTYYFSIQNDDPSNQYCFYLISGLFQKCCQPDIIPSKCFNINNATQTNSSMKFNNTTLKYTIEKKDIFYNFNSIKSNYFNTISYSYLILNEDGSISTDNIENENENLKQTFKQINLPKDQSIAKEIVFKKNPEQHTLSDLIKLIAKQISKTSSCEKIKEWFKSKTKTDNTPKYTIFFLVIKDQHLNLGSDIYNMIYDISTLPFSLIIIPISESPGKSIYTGIDNSYLTTSASTTFNNTCVSVAELYLNDEYDDKKKQQFYNKITEKVEKNLQRYISFYENILQR